MRAVWSFWSAPYVAHYRHAWVRPIDHLLSWVVSVQTARSHYDETALVTDTAGRQLLVEQLGLSFSDVSTDLDDLRDADPDWWMLGKLVGYSRQNKPFVHIDSDVFLWKALPAHVAAAPVFAQNPEQHVSGGDYRPADITLAMQSARGQLPPEWEWACSRGPVLQAENCGILGGQNATFLQHYAQSAIDLLLRPGNRPAWQRLPDKQQYNFVVEQFFLSACIGYHSDRLGSPYHGVRAGHVFASWTEAFDPNLAARLGYTHLMAAKRHPATSRRLEARVRRDWPDFHRRCERWQDALPN
jgi:hypothetical protein